MASTNAARHRPWRKSTWHLLRKLFCCLCLQGEEKDPLQEQERKISGGHQQPHLDQQGSGKTEVIQITVEDVGIVNTSFSLDKEEDLMTQKKSIVRSASSVSACTRALKKKPCTPLSSLPIWPKAKLSTTSRSVVDDKEDREEELLFESTNNSMDAPGSLLTQPVINLIPPTPSDVADDDQFFDIDSEESVANTYCSDGSFAVGEQESSVVKMVKEEAETSTEEVSAHDAAESEDGLSNLLGGEKEALPTKDGDTEKTELMFLCSGDQVAPLHEYSQKTNPHNGCPGFCRCQGSFNTVINILSPTEENLDHLSDRGVSSSDMLKTDLCLLPHTTNMNTLTHQRRPITRSRSVGDTLTRVATFHALTQSSDHEEGEGPQLRRATVASYMPQSKDQNRNFSEKDIGRQVAKSLEKLNTDEVCQWFKSIRLQKCLPFIRDANMCGADIASVDLNTLDILHINALEDKEQLLSAIYNELHPPTTITQRINSLLESLGPNNVKTFTDTLMSMTKSKTSPHVSCLSMNRRSLRNANQNNTVRRNSQLVEITINASERIVHLRTPKETTVGKILDSCIKMLGMIEDKSLYKLKETKGALIQDSSEELPPDQQIGSLPKLKTENRQLELYLWKTEKSSFTQSNSEVSDPDENINLNKNVQVNQTPKEERIKELNQQVDSLQNVILQVQELHHDLVEFCSELKNMDGDVNVERLDSFELKQRMDLVKSRLNNKRMSLQALKDNINNSAAHKKQLDVHLLEKMKINCQVFKEEISMVHLNRQVAHLQKALQETHVKEKAQKNSLAVGSLSQLLSLQSPAMLLVIQENHNSSGHYGFTCHHREASGLVVVKVDNSFLCVGDRLVEVNGVSVVNTTLEGLADILLQGCRAQIVVLRQPPPTQQQPLLLQHMTNPDLMQTISAERDVFTTETTPQRKVMAI